MISISGFSSSSSSNTVSDKKDISCWGQWRKSPFLLTVLSPYIPLVRNSLFGRSEITLRTLPHQSVPKIAQNRLSTALLKSTITSSNMQLYVLGFFVDVVFSSSIIHCLPVQLHANTNVMMLTSKIFHSMLKMKFLFLCKLLN